MKTFILSLQKIGTLTACFLFLSTGILFGQEKSQQIKDLLSKYHEYGQFNGSVLVANDGEVIFADGYGMANMEHDIPNRPRYKTPGWIYHQTVYCSFDPATRRRRETGTG